MHSHEEEYEKADCKNCRNNINVAWLTDGFCSIKCRVYYEQWAGGEKALEEQTRLALIAAGEVL